MTNDLDTTPQRIAPSRRTVLRTAAHAAWAVPAVQIATSVPAFASVSNHAKIDLVLTNTPTSSTGNPKKATLDLTVTNNGVSTKTGGGNASAVLLSFSNLGFASVDSVTGAGATKTATTVSLPALASGTSVRVSVTVVLDKKTTSDTDPAKYNVTVTPTATSTDGTTAGTTGSPVTAIFS